MYVGNIYIYSGTATASMASAGKKSIGKAVEYIKNKSKKLIKK